MVMMCSRRRALMRSSRAAMVEVLPEPVGPVRRMRPWRRSVSLAAGGVADEAEVEGLGVFELLGLSVGEERKEKVADVVG